MTTTFPAKWPRARLHAQEAMIDELDGLFFDFVCTYNVMFDVDAIALSSRVDWDVYTIETG